MFSSCQISIIKMNPVAKNRSLINSSTSNNNTPSPPQSAWHLHFGRASSNESHPIYNPGIDYPSEYCYAGILANPDNRWGSPPSSQTHTSQYICTEHNPALLSNFSHLWSISPQTTLMEFWMGIFMGCLSKFIRCSSFWTAGIFFWTPGLSKFIRRITL